jgi:hypothetical protein
LGEIHLENRRWDEAEVHYEQAHQISQQISSREWVGVSAYGMARAASDKGNREGAARWGREALMSLQDIRHPKAEEVEAWLDGLDGPH